MIVLGHHWEYENYDIIHFIVSFLYLMLSFFCVYSFIKRPNKTRQVLSQLIFYPLLFIGVTVRAVFMFLQPFIREQEFIQIPNQINILLNSLPSFNFFTIYLVVLFIWIEIYFLFRGSVVSIRRLPTIFNTITILMYLCLITLYIIDFTMYPLQSNPISAFINLPELIIGYYDASCFIVASLLFVFFGVSLIFRFRSPHQKNFTEEKRKIILKRIAGLTILTVACFICRATITLFALIKMNSISGEFWWFDGVYYILFEIIPLWIMIYLLRMDKNKIRGTQDLTNERTALINSA